MRQLDGKVAIVTGAGRGIGRAIACLFAAEGAAVVVAARTAGEGDETVALIQQAGGGARFIPTDVSQDAQVRDLVAETVQSYGRLDMLVNNAGIGGPESRSTETSEVEWDRVIDTNLERVLPRNALRHPAYAARRAARSSIVVRCLAELTASRPNRLHRDKAAIIGLTKATALEVGGDGIRVNCILPGSTDTPMMWDGLTETERIEVEPLVAGAAPLGKVGKPEEIARVALFLVSDASSFMTGASVLVDGGLSPRIATVR